MTKTDELAKIVYERFSDIKIQYPYDDYDATERCPACGAREVESDSGWVYEPHLPDCVIMKMLELAKEILGIT